MVCREYGGNYNYNYNYNYNWFQKKAVMCWAHK